MLPPAGTQLLQCDDHYEYTVSASQVTYGGCCVPGAEECTFTDDVLGRLPNAKRNGVPYRMNPRGR